MGMGCDRYRDAVSARVDGEDPGLPDTEIDAHLASCPSCEAFDAAARRMRRRLALYDTDAVPDASRRVVKRTGAEDRRRTTPVLRWLLAAVAVGIIVIAVPDFLSTDPHAHSLRHVGAFSLAYAAGLILVAVRPARARTMLHVAFVLGGALVATTALDVARGSVTLFGESVHLLEITSAVLLWGLSRPGSTGGSLPSAQVMTDETVGLRVVRLPDDDQPDQDPPQR